MPSRITLHYDNSANLHDPHLWVWYDGGALPDDYAPTGTDSFGLVYAVDVKRPSFRFKFKAGPGSDGPWEPDSLNRFYRPLEETGAYVSPPEIWARGDKAFVYPVEPRLPEIASAAAWLSQLPFKHGIYVPSTGGFSGLGANLLEDGRVAFGLYHPNAARVYVTGSFNNWQQPGSPNADPSQFIELKLYRGYFDLPNTWLAVTDQAHAGDEYKFFVQGGVPRDQKGRLQQIVTDPYARHLGTDFRENNAVILDPTTYVWNDSGWHTPDMSELIIYELSVYGFTEGDPEIETGNQGCFKGITERIESGYFDRLGTTALSLMPLAEVPTPEGPNALGYNPSLYFAVERDFGAPDDLRELVDIAHRKGLAVLIDQVFNHTSNDFNPLWKLILEHPDEEANALEGGLYFNGTTPWGNRVDTAKVDVQNMLIDACKLLLTEYHVDGFRFDATHHDDFIDGSLLDRMARELRGFKPDVLLVAENLPNQSDLNRQGYDGYAQWCDPFHDKIKALLREAQFEGQFPTPDGLGEIFYFNKTSFAAHTNNVVNYCESHDEHSVSYEVGFVPSLNNPAAKERKARLGLFATLVALGQPMIYMGQEFNTERPRNIVTVDWADDLESHGFFQWASRLICLRRRYPGLRLHGYNPIADGTFVWRIAPWLDARHGGGRRVIGWSALPNGQANDMLLVLLNFEPDAVEVDLDLGIAGIWVRLADIDAIDDIPPFGTNSVQRPDAIRTGDGTFNGFVLPSSSGFIYKWESPY